MSSVHPDPDSVFEIKEVILAENNEPLVGEDGNILCHVVDAQGNIDIVGIAPDIANTIVNMRSPGESVVEDEKKDDWDDEQTRYVLDKYYDYLPEVGPMKRFRLKKDMWSQIANEINKKYKCSKTSTQTENRYKTIMKRKKKAVDNNQTSGAKRLKINFEEELQKISSIDDSIQPEVLQDQGTIVKKEKPMSAPAVKENRNDTVLKYLKKINEEKRLQREQHHKEKESNKERRHHEKLELLRELFNKT